MQDKERIDQQHQEKLAALQKSFTQSNLQLERTEVKPQKSDIEIDRVALLWMPWRISAAGTAERAY